MRLSHPGREAYRGEMAGWIELLAAVVAMAVVLKVALAAMLGGLYEWRSWRFLGDRLRRPSPPPAPRPLSQIVADVRRISTAYHRAGMRFAQYEGRRQAYDRVLVEAAAAIGAVHLLDVLAPGPERDAERRRVEGTLELNGLLPPRSGRA